MTQSPQKKRPKLQNGTSKKRPINLNDQLTNSTQKRCRSEESEEIFEAKIANMKKKNFIKACEKVSQQAYFDYKKRFMLPNVTKCIKGSCKHRDPRNSILPISTSVKESFKIAIRTNSWYEALDNFHICLTQNPRNYLTECVLKDILEIMLNAHEDIISGQCLNSIINKCNLILSLSFHLHPTCISKSLKKTYNLFLTSPMDLKSDSFTNRAEFNCNKGVIKYCWNRLENEMLSEASDEPLINKVEFIPDNMKQSVQGLFWQKEKFEIFETLARTDRISRLMNVLDSVLPLLQSDLAIWHSRHASNQGVHMLKCDRPLIASILWPDNVRDTGSFNNACQQIIKIFVDLICLGYPLDHVKTVTVWLNTIIQTFYMCEPESNSDYPNIGMYITRFANGFYKIIKDLPICYILKILRILQPTYMRHLVGTLHLQSVLNTKDNDILKILIEVLNKSSWLTFSTADTNLEVQPNRNVPKHIKELITFDLDKINNTKVEYNYSKDILEISTGSMTQNEFIQLLYITFEAYLDSFSLQNLQNTLEEFNEMLKLINVNSKEPECELKKESDNNYFLTLNFLRNYTSIYKLLKEFDIKFSNMRIENKLHDDFNIFNNIIRGGRVDLGPRLINA